MSEVCKIHNINKIEKKEYVPIFDEFGEFIYDEMEVPKSSETIIYECPICEKEKLDRENQKFYINSPIDAMEVVHERIEEIKREHPGELTIREKENKKNFLEVYVDKISHITDAPLEACRAMLQFHISLSLLNAKYSNTKGRIFSNVSFIWIAPSGSNKTPLIDLTIEKISPNIYPEFRKYGMLTGKGLRKDLSIIKDKNNIQPIMIIWDEMSTMAKDAKNDGTSDLYEVLSEVFDGKLTPYASVRGGYETYPSLYSNLWISGVPSFLEQTDKSFWYQGFGLRSLFLQYTTVEPKDLTDQGQNEIKEFYDNLENDLSIMKYISEVNTTAEFLLAYNEFRKQILRDIQNVQKDILTSQDPEIFPIISKAKYPVLVMKLAIINATSRWNFTESGLLTLEKEDLDRAIIDLDKYHENMIQMFNVWQELVENKSRIDNIKNLTDKIKRHINTILKSDKGFDLNKENQDGDIIYIANHSENGKWVAHASLLRLSHLTSKNFNELIQTLEDQLMIVKREGQIVNSSVIRVTTFYKLI